MPAVQTLETLRPGMRATIRAVDWRQIAPEDAKRLQALGIDKGADIVVAHRGVLGGRDPLAINVGRAMVAISRVHAQAITVEIVAEAAA